MSLTIILPLGFLYYAFSRMLQIWSEWIYCQVDTEVNTPAYSTATCSHLLTQAWGAATVEHWCVFPMAPTQRSVEMAVAIECFTFRGSHVGKFSMTSQQLLALFPSTYAALMPLSEAVTEILWFCFRCRAFSYIVSCMLHACRHIFSVPEPAESARSSLVTV